jgi:hypothetical protein
MKVLENKVFELMARRAKTTDMKYLIVYDVYIIYISYQTT